VWKIGLGLEILSAYARVRWLLHRRDLPATIEVLRAPSRRDRPAPATADELEAGLRLGRAVGRVLGALPLDDRCLMRALVLTRLLAARRLESSLVIGVTAEPEFGAHAWVERGETALLPRNGSAFEQLVRL
jgi:hypothetical protein